MLSILHESFASKNNRTPLEIMYAHIHILSDNI